MNFKEHPTISDYNVSNDVLYWKCANYYTGYFCFSTELTQNFIDLIPSSLNFKDCRPLFIIEINSNSIKIFFSVKMHSLDQIYQFKKEIYARLDQISFHFKILKDNELKNSIFFSYSKVTSDITQITIDNFQKMLVLSSSNQNDSINICKLNLNFSKFNREEIKIINRFLSSIDVELIFIIKCNKNKINISYLAISSNFDSIEKLINFLVTYDFISSPYKLSMNLTDFVSLVQKKNAETPTFD